MSDVPVPVDDEPQSEVVLPLVPVIIREADVRLPDTPPAPEPVPGEQYPPVPPLEPDPDYVPIPVPGFENEKRVPPLERERLPALPFAGLVEPVIGSDPVPPIESFEPGMPYDAPTRLRLFLEANPDVVPLVTVL